MSDSRYVVYTAGKYRAPTEYEVWQNIEAARLAGVELLRAGWFPLIPHANSAFMGGVVPDEIFLQGDLDLIRRTVDAMYMLIGWEDSQGARREHEYARELGIPIYYQAPFTPPPLCSASKTRIWL